MTFSLVAPRIKAMAAAKQFKQMVIYIEACESVRDHCHSAAPPSPFSRCFNTDGEGMPVKRQSRRRQTPPCATRATCATGSLGPSAPKLPE